MMSSFARMLLSFSLLASIVTSAMATPYEYDYAISKQLKAYLVSKIRTANTGQEVRYEVVNGVVLLTGALPTKADVDGFATFAQGLPNVKRVENAVSPGSPISAPQKSIDAGIERDLATAEQANHYLRVLASRGVLYLLGFVTKQEKDAIVAQAQQVKGINRIVLLFEYIDTPEELTSRQNSSESALEGDDGDEDMSRDEALSILAGALLNHAASEKVGKGNTAQLKGGIPAQRSAQSTVRNQSPVQQISAAPAISSSASAGNDANRVKQDRAYPECLVLESHPTATGYRQYRNTCGFEINVLRCIEVKGNNECRTRILGAFHLKPFATDITLTLKVNSIVCKSPFRALSTKVVWKGEIFTGSCETEM